jgi:hypothetical protein
LIGKTTYALINPKHAEGKGELEVKGDIGNGRDLKAKKEINSNKDASNEI